MYYELTLNICSFLYGYVCGRLGAIVARERPKPLQSSQLRRDERRMSMCDDNFKPFSN